LNKIKTDNDNYVEMCLLGSMYSARKTTNIGVTRSLIPWTYPLAGCRIDQMYKIRSNI